MRRGWKRDIHGFAIARCQPLRSSQRQRPRALGDDLRLQQQKRNTSEMVAMKMGHEDGVDRVAIDLQSSQSHERGGAAIDEKIGCFANDMKASVEATAGSECIPATNELQMHPLPPPSAAARFADATLGTSAAYDNPKTSQASISHPARRREINKEPRATLFLQSNGFVGRWCLLLL